MSPGTGPLASPRCRPGRRTASGSSGCARCSPRSAIRSALPRDPRRRHERQVDGDDDDRGSCCSRRACRSARPSRRTSARWAERIRVDGGEADLERALARVRPAAEAVGATQFETITAAALAEFAAARGRRRRRRGRARRPARRDERAARAGRPADERRARAHRRARATTRGGDRDARSSPLSRRRQPSSSSRTTRCAALVPGRPRRATEGAREAAEAFVGHPIASARRRAAARSARASETGEIRDGAHNPDGVALADERGSRLRDYTVCASILADKDVDEMLRELAGVGRRPLVATASSNARSLTAAGSAERAAPPLRARRGRRRAGRGRRAGRTSSASPSS